ncbi:MULTISPECIES: N-acetylmuramic acid 6-phosphate etherase [unclassified Roseitalea]|uniref:N-acetylmuramic acid 6-phosphate etherase n=1 Tax=unclassified Roseitalea TaxID=2639107 RepID=UPI00273E0125|nr:MULTISPECIES: N-acetylmuramic acid 6-phosphate etherase [unclassified Roseitalea]
MTHPTTETASARYDGIEDWPTAEIVAAITESQLHAAAIVSAQSAVIVEAVDRAAARIGTGGRLIYLGAGTSGRIATQDAAELLPTFAWPPERAVSVMAGGKDAFTRAIEGAEDDGAAAEAEIDALGVGEADIVIGVAASGNTPFAVAGIARARRRGALTIGIMNNAHGRLGPAAEIAIVTATGPEVVAGSTRMKAGTAQKIALNAFSTALMVRLGFVWRGRMVEMRPTNAKLERRARLMVADLTGADEAASEQALKAAGGSIKRAVVMLTLDCDSAAAQAALDANDGHLGRTLAAATG